MNRYGPLEAFPVAVLGANHERALLFNCATGLKYPMPPVGRTLDRLQPIDFATL